jgi:hypothetical protein
MMSNADPPRWATAIALLLPALCPPVAAAELKLNPPSIEAGEFSLENNSAVVLRRARPADAARTHFVELGYGVTDYWWTEVEGQWNTSDGRLKFRTVDFENAVRLVPQGSYWPETALFVEYDQAVAARSADSATLAGLFRKDVGAWNLLLNVFLDHEFGRDASTGTRLRYAGISTWTVRRPFAPGIQFFGQPGKLLHFDRARAQDHRLGPVLAGAVEIEGTGEVAYSVGYLYGLTPAAPAATLAWRLELDVRF